MSDKLTLKFDPNTIEHLGVSLYSKLPSVLSELISNSWDADAENVDVTFDFTSEIRSHWKIIIKDDGWGMTFDDCQNRFLTVGFDRRDGEPGPQGRHPYKGRGRAALARIR